MFARLSMRSALAVLVVLGTIGAARQASAQAAAPQSQLHQPTPAAILVAKQIVALKDVGDIYVPLVRGVVQKSRDAFMQTNFMWAKDLNEVAAIEQKQYAPRVSELVEATARIYASHFTEQELKELLAYYQSPIGQKAIAEEPKIIEQSMASAGSWGDNLAQEVMASMRAEMKKRGHDM
jgi:hypothetical protein